MTFKVPIEHLILPNVEKIPKISNMSSQNRNIHQFLIDSSNFTTVRILLDWTKISNDYQILPLIIMTFFKAFTEVNGTSMNSDQINKFFEKSSVHFWSSLGISLDCSSRYKGNLFPSVFELGFVCDKDDILNILDVFESLLARSEISIETLEYIVKMMKSQISSQKRSGQHLLQDLVSSKLFPDSIYDKFSLFSCSKFLNSESFSMSTTHQKITKFISDLWKNRNDLTSISITSPIKFDYSFIDQITSHLHLDTVNCAPTQLSVEPTFQDNVTLLSSPSISSSFASIVSSGPSSFLFPNKEALLLAIEFLVQIEGPLYSPIRGNGLAYHFDLTCDCETGTIKFDVIDSVDVTRVFDVFADVIRSIISDGRLDDVLFKSAVSSLVYSLTESHGTAFNSAFKSTFYSIKGIPVDYCHEFIHSVVAVQPDDVLRAINQWILPVIEGSRFVVCPASAEKKYLEFFANKKMIVETVNVVDLLGSDSDSDSD
ncbi:hypothetical protein GEMRC1_003885 [Eukaryota sp. GEM-RC1]